MISINAIPYWTERWFKSCDRLRRLNESANPRIEPVIKLEQAFNNYCESQLMIAYQLKETFGLINIKQSKGVEL